MTVSVALVDDHLVFREAFRALLAATSEFSVVAEATEGKEVCPLFESTKPDVVVMDVTLPGTDGLSAARELTSRHPGAKIMMLSAHAVHDYVTRAFAAGCRRLRAQVAAGGRGNRRAQVGRPRRSLLGARAAGDAAHERPNASKGRAGSARRAVEPRARDLRSRGARLLERVDLRRALDQREDGRDPSGEHQPQAGGSLEHPAPAVRRVARPRLRVTRHQQGRWPPDGGRRTRSRAVGRSSGTCPSARGGGEPPFDERSADVRPAPGNTSSDRMKTSLTRAQIEHQVKALGPWFHNIDLAGIQTAPEHFLGDYPRARWQRFSHSVATNLTGKSILDVGCNAGYYAIEMKRRGAHRVLGIDSDEASLDQARFAARVSGVDVEFRRMSVYDLPELSERFDLVLFLGVFNHLRHPLLALDVLHEYAVGDSLVFQSALRGDGGHRAHRTGLSVQRDRGISRARVSAHALRRAPIRRRSDSLVDSEPLVHGSHAPERRFRDRLSPDRRSLRVPPSAAQMTRARIRSHGVTRRVSDAGLDSARRSLAIWLWSQPTNSIRPFSNSTFGS